MTTAWRMVCIALALLCAHATAATPARPMTPQQMDAALAALSGDGLALSSPRMRAFLSRAFPNGGEETCEGPFDGQDAQNNCQWFGVIGEDDPSPWPRFFLFFENNALVSVMTHDAKALRASRHWRCQTVRDQRRMGFTDCIRADLPAARVAPLRKAHLDMVNGAD